MKKVVLLAVLFTGCIFLNNAFGQSAFDKKDSLAINAVSDNFEAAFNAHDAKKLAALFNLDAEFTNVVGASAKGRKAIEEFHAPMFQGKPGYFSFKNSTLKNGIPKISVIRPDIASVDIPWTMDKCILPNGAELKNRKGLVTLLVVKTQGRWGIAIMHNAELTPPDGK